MTDTMTSQNIVLSSWDTLYIVKIKQGQELNLAVHHVLFSCKKKYIYSVQFFYDHFGLLQQTVLGVPNTHDLNHKSVIPLIPQKFSLPCNMS
jgi:hypothetical protein